MLHSHSHNLMIQLAEDSQSLCRMKGAYIKDAAGCSECVELWRRLAEQKEKEIQVLEKALSEHLEQQGIGASEKQMAMAGARDK